MEPICQSASQLSLTSWGLRWIVLICAATGLLSAAEPASNSGLDFFERRIRPVLIEQCYSCHSANAEKLKGGLLLDSLEGMLKGGEHGPVLVAHHPEKSRLIEAIRWEDEDTQMPPKKKLTPIQIDDFVAWVTMGAPAPVLTSDRNKQPVNPTKGSTHWAFQPPILATPPLVRRPEWLHTPVDAFILKGLENKGLSPSPTASRRTLIRRAFYDLTGLPPKAEEVESFVADTRPQAYAHLIEKLLASPFYGERWGRHWLDVARYADTKGYIYTDREEARFVHSYLYRDWVVQSFNNDLPYDRFLLHQLASDQLGDSHKSENGQIPPVAGLGFLTIGRRFLGVTPDIIDDQIDVMMRGMQGLTVACARCHDHKFDPIPIQDYYSLYGVFNSSSDTMVRLGNTNTTGRSEFESGLAQRQQKLSETYEKKKSELVDRMRAKVRDYWVALPGVDKLPTDDHYEIRGLDDLNPTVVRQWQQYLFQSSNRFDPLFAPWHSLSRIPARDFSTEASPAWTQLKATQGTNLNSMIRIAMDQKFPADISELARIYGDIFHKIYEEVSAAREPDRTAGLSPEKRPWSSVLFGPSSPARVPSGSLADIEWLFDEGGRVEFGKLQSEIDRWINQSTNAPAFAVILQDRPEPRVARVFKRGNPATKGEEVPRQFLKIVAGPDRQRFQNGSGRLEMAEAISSADNPLTARVMVNRVWMHHFGRGLVSTPSDFGTRCEPPSHPELLDYLAVRFMSEGWSVKNLHRIIMLSNAYQQSSTASEPTLALQRDPENRLYWKMHSSRIHLEPLRDSILKSSDSLDQTIGGRPVSIFDSNLSTRRTLYGFVDRQFLPGVFRVFDFPNPDLSNPQRSLTTVPQQALFLMNNSFLAENARNLLARPEVRHAQSETAKINELYRAVFQRLPEKSEWRVMRTFLKATARLPVEPVVEPAPPAWSYGYGKMDTNTLHLQSFTPLPFFKSGAWQGGDVWPNPHLGSVRITDIGGHTGNDPDRAAIRRWKSTFAGSIRITGHIEHPSKEKDGIRAWIISDKQGSLASWTLSNKKEMVALPAVSVQKGETINFVVDLGADQSSNEFLWAPIIKRVGNVADEVEWNAQKDFSGPPAPPPVALTAWENFAQSLLLSNEFVFID